MKPFDKLLLFLGLLTTLVLAIIFLPKLNSGLSASLGAGAATFINGIWIAVQILFFVAVVLGITFAVLRFKQMNRTQMIIDAKDGRQVRAIIHDGKLVQLNPGGQNFMEILKLQQQQATQLQQHWKMIGVATTSMKRFMDEYDVEEGDEEEGVVDGTVETKLLEGPRQPATIYNLSDQLKSQATLIDEEDSIIGYVDGEPLRGRLFGEDNNMMDSIFVVGDQGFGKSVLAVYMHVLNVMHGGRTLIIDPDAEFGQSLSKRLGPLADPHFLLCPIASTPEAALHILDIAEDELEDPSAFPVLFLIDEFTLLMRSAANKESKWYEVGKRLANIAENWATRGRKRRRRAIVFGQITKATRSGGTELRDSMTTVCFHLKERRARLVLEPEEAGLVPDLKTGQVLVVPVRSSEPSYLMQLPFPDEAALNAIANYLIQSGRFGRIAGELPGVESTRILPETKLDRRMLESEEAPQETAVVTRNTGELRMDTIAPLERLGESPENRPADYPLMNESQITQFLVLYPLHGLETALDRIKGCSHKHREHGRALIAQHHLKRERRKS